MKFNIINEYDNPSLRQLGISAWLSTLPSVRQTGIDAVAVFWSSRTQICRPIKNIKKAR